MAQLSVQDSLSRTKTPLLLSDPSGRKITWYACGPTVYDDAHIGHARNYVSTDIIRRILQDYLGYEVQFAMNITDVDDKIIIAARRKHLLDEWWSQHTLANDQVRNATVAAYKEYVEKNLPAMSQPASPEAYTDNAISAYGHVLDVNSLANDESMPGEDEAKIKMHLATAKSASEALLLPTESRLNDFKSKAAGVLLPYVDSLYKHQVKGDSHDIFNNRARHFENRFFEDMRNLNVLAPDNVTRVTEYMPKIIGFIRQIENNKLAYKLDHEASVYFDVQAFESSDGRYSKLQAAPKQDSNQGHQVDSFSTAKNVEYKRSGADFALWKASKEGEPSWDSPWGKGRPGWHIECSAMATDILGRQIDIHSGGIDLAFPHHENELAQSEAYWMRPGEEIKPCVNNFLHMGHLHIEGHKMSKSLKNFITIRDALSRQGWTARRLRIVFLRGAWREGFDFTNDAIVNGAAGWEERVNDLFLKARDLQRRSRQEAVIRTSEADGETTDLDQGFKEKQKALHTALLDSFDTATAMNEISALTTAYNIAYSEQRISQATSMAISKWITDIVVMLGLDAHYKEGQIGWSGLELPNGAEPFVYQLSQLRDRVREQAKSDPVKFIDVGIIDEAERHNGFAAAYTNYQGQISDLQARSAGPNDYLLASDRLRDFTLWDLGVHIEDLHGGRGLVQPISATLKDQKLRSQTYLADRAAVKQKAQAEAVAAERIRLEKGKLPHTEMFRSSAEFTSWDEDGLPTKDSKGKDVPKTKAKKMQKDWERQKKLHLAYVASLTKQQSPLDGRPR